LLGLILVAGEGKGRKSGKLESASQKGSLTSFYHKNA